VVFCEQKDESLQDVMNAYVVGKVEVII
jgi:hypothetical protein